MITLSRGQLITDRGVDVTVRAKLHVSPVWGLVMAYRTGRITEERYTERYLRLLNNRKERVLEWAKELQADTRLLCYCEPGLFCHVDLLIDWLINEDSNFRRK